MNDIIPQKGGQWEFLSQVKVDEILYGGAAGPGKSWSLVVDALGLQYEAIIGKRAIDIPSYRAVLFRRKTTQFTKLIDEGKKYYPAFGGTFVYTRAGDPGPSFNFPSGARIFICHLEQESNKEDHQGQEYQYAGFDELTQFTVTQYTYLLSRLRSTEMGLNSRLRATTNPTGSGLIWVKKRFIRNGTQNFLSNKVYYFKHDTEQSIEDNPTGVLTNRADEYAKSRMFIPGNLKENKVLMDADPNYMLNIMAMGSQYQKALLEGDWDAFGGEFFSDFSSNTMKIQPFEIPADWRLIGSLDPGWSSPCSFGLHASDYEGNVYRLVTYYQKGLSPQEHANNIFALIKEFPFTSGRMPSYIVSGRDAFAKKEQYSIQASDRTFSDVFQNAGLHLIPAKTDRVLGWMAFKQLMRQGKWFYFDGYNDNGIEEITAAPPDEKAPEDIKGKGNDPNVQDHFLDENRYGIMSLFTPTKRQQQEPQRLKKEDLLYNQNSIADY